MDISPSGIAPWPHNVEGHKSANTIISPPYPSRPLTTFELCDFLQASKSTIDQYNREGMPRFFVGKQCRYVPHKVLDWLERRTKQRVRPQIGVLAQG